MDDLLDFEKEEKGFKPFIANRANIKANIGKAICYVTYVDPYRGNYRVHHAVIHSIRYSRLFIDNGHDEVNIRGIKQAGIKID